MKPRTSSPLKHEYHPSDVSSSSSDTDSDNSESDSDSSSDELEEIDVPDTLPGISIKKTDTSAVESVISDDSLTPSNSASQVGLRGIRMPTPAYTLKFTATVSYWSDKRGTWKDISTDRCSIVVTPGLIEAYRSSGADPDEQSQQLNLAGTPDAGNKEGNAGATRPLIALDLTPVVMIRQSTLIDLEVRSPMRSYSQFNKIDAAFFRFRAPSGVECTNLYAAVHRSRMDNEKYKALEEEARFRSFGQQQEAGAEVEGSTSSRRRSWFGRRNSYRASARAPSQSQGSSAPSSVSASSFLKQLIGGNNHYFDIDKSTLGRQSRPGSAAGGAGLASAYSSSASSSAGGGGGEGSTPPRSPSVSLAESGSRAGRALGSDNLRIRCHLQASYKKWEDHGNCHLQVSRPPPGHHQEMHLYSGLEKRIRVTTVPKKEGEKPLVVLDAVLGSKCFGRLGTKGIVLNIWEDLRDAEGNVGVVPASGGLSGRVKKWCFQCHTTAEANWIFGLVAQEVVIA
jgi:hypothetical protein